MNKFNVQVARETTTKVGRRGEEEAAQWLRSQGFEVEKSSDNEDLQGIDLWISKNGKKRSVQVKAHNTPYQKLIKYWTSPGRSWGSQHICMELDGGNKYSGKSCYDSELNADYMLRVWLHVGVNDTTYKRFVVTNYRFEKAVYQAYKRRRPTELKNKSFQSGEQNYAVNKIYEGKYYVARALNDSENLTGLYVPMFEHLHAQDVWLQYRAITSKTDIGPFNV